MSASRSSMLVAALLAAAACQKPGADSTPGSAREQGEVSAEAPPACGTLVYAIGEGHEHGHSELARLRLEPGARPQVLAFEGLDVDRDRARARYPAALSPDGNSLLILASSPSPDGKTRDRFELLDLHGDQPPEVLATPQDVVLRNPSWSPAGSFIVFESGANSFRDLYRHDLAGGSTLRLTDDAEGNFEPTVSPDGQSIAFVSSRDGNAELYVMTADGGSPRRLTTSAGDDSAPCWSPEGHELAFLSARDRSRGIDVFVIPATGGDAEPLVATRQQPIIARDLAWSPSGSQLAFTQLAPKAGEAAVVIVDRKTGSIMVETDTPGVEEQPGWSPDGKQLVFARGGHEGSDLFRLIVDPPGSRAPIQITDGSAVAWLPRWTIAPNQDCPRTSPPVAPPKESGQG